jgi:hypothetical protein
LTLVVDDVPIFFGHKQLRALFTNQVDAIPLTRPATTTTSKEAGNRLLPQHLLNFVDVRAEWIEPLCPTGCGSLGIRGWFSNVEIETACSRTSSRRSWCKSRFEIRRSFTSRVLFTTGDGGAHLLRIDDPEQVGNLLRTRTRTDPKLLECCSRCCLGLHPGTNEPQCLDDTREFGSLSPALVAHLGTDQTSFLVSLPLSSILSAPDALLGFTEWSANLVDRREPSADSAREYLVERGDLVRASSDLPRSLPARTSP